MIFVNLYALDGKKIIQGEDYPDGIWVIVALIQSQTGRVPRFNDTKTSSRGRGILRGLRKNIARVPRRRRVCSRVHNHGAAIMPASYLSIWVRRVSRSRGLRKEHRPVQLIRRVRGNVSGMREDCQPGNRWSRLASPRSTIREPLIRYRDPSRLSRL